MATVREQSNTKTKKPAKTARIRHIAIACDDPERTANLYADAFGLEKRYKVDEAFATGWEVTDGYISVAILKFSDEYLKAHDGDLGDKFRPGFTGLHHIGFHVDDKEQTVETLREYGAYPLTAINDFLEERKGESNYAADGKGKDELKMRGLEGECFEVCQVDWTVAE